MWAVVPHCQLQGTTGFLGVDFLLKFLFFLLGTKTSENVKDKAWMGGRIWSLLLQSDNQIQLACFQNDFVGIRSKNLCALCPPFGDETPRMLLFIFCFAPPLLVSEHIIALGLAHWALDVCTPFLK